MDWLTSKIKYAGIALLLCLLALTVCSAADGFYRVEQRNNGIWWFVTPDGQPFFSNGVNVVDVGNTRERYNPENPGYAAFRYYANDEAWIEETLIRLKSWNFNTIGGWSSEKIHRRGAMPYTKVLHLGGGKYVPWGDMFGEEVAARINEEARREIGNLKNDRNLIGYFSDNELGWWDDTLFWHFLNQPAANKTRRILLQLMRRHYAGNFAGLRRDFDTGTSQTFAALESQANLTLKPEGNGAKVIDKFVFLLAERYYKLVHDAIRRYDPNHLILGDRYPSWYSQSVVRASIPYIDVVSTNYMADWTDGKISHFYLDTLHRLTGKPVIITEYYMSAMENRSGNENSSAGFPVVQTQKQRAESFQANLTAFAELPYVIGAHWFQYYDEPTNGRSDGENYNMGLIDIHNKPYEELTAAARQISPDLVHAKALIEKKNNLTIVPKAEDGVEKGLLEWNKELSLVAANQNMAKDLPFADLYASWDKKHLYLTVYAIDFTEARIYARNTIPEMERMTWTIKTDSNSKPIQVRFGAGSEPKISDSTLEIQEWTTPTRNTLMIKLPPSAVGKKEWRTGDKISLQANLASHSRAEQMEWKQTLTLGK